MQTIKSVEDDPARYVESAASPGTVSYNTPPLINDSSELCQCSDWYSKGKASSRSVSHWLHTAASGMQVNHSWQHNFLELPLCLH